MSPVAAGRSAFAILKPHWPIVLFLLAGALASLWASNISPRAIFILIAGTAATGLLAGPLLRVREPVAKDSSLQQAAAIATDMLAKQFESSPDGIFVITDAPLRVSINQKLIALLRLAPALASADDPDASIAAICERIADPDRLRADIVQLKRDPTIAIHRELELTSGDVVELHAGRMEQAAGPSPSLMSFFVFHDIRDKKHVERELQLANTLLETQMQASPFGILVVSDAGVVTSFNQQFLKLTRATKGYHSGDLDINRITAFADEVRDPEAFLARIHYLRAHPDEGARDEIIMKDGQVLERTSVPLTGPDGQSYGRIWYFSDVTVIRGAARASEEERNLLSALLDSLPGYFALINSAGRLIRWNESLRLLNGLSDEDIMGSDPFANILAEDRTQTLTKLRETIVEGSAELEFRIRTKSRGIRSIRWHGRRITVNGDPQALAVGIDVTDMRAAEALLRANEERFRIIFESVSDGILLQDAVTEEFLDANPRGHDMFGYTREEFLALRPEDVTAGTRPEAATKLEGLRDVAPVDGHAFEWQCLAKDGRVFSCEIARRYANFGGRDVFLSTLRDVTERNRGAADVSYRDRILHTLTVSTAELVKTSSFADSMPALLASVGEELGVDRLLLIQRTGMEHAPRGVALRFGWERPGVAPVDLAFAPATHASGVAETERWFAPLYRGLPVEMLASSASETVQKVLQNSGIVSNLLVPVFVGGTYWGHFGVDDTRQPRAWTSVEIEALQTLADLIGALLTRERTESALQQSEEQFRTVSEKVLDAIIMIGIDGRIRFWNPSAERIFGYTAAEAEGKQIHDWLTPERFRAEAHRGLAHFAATGEGPILGRTVEFPARRKDGVEIDTELAINEMHVGPERYAVGIARDVTERKAASALIERMATHDALTGLPNRRQFIDALDGAIGRARRSGQIFAVLYLDIDHFKDVNDTLGHPVGDRFLQMVGERLSASVRDIDTVARFGGDEFAAIQIDIREPSDAAVLAAKLVRVLDETFAIDGNDVHSGTSVGIAVYGPDSPDAEALLAHADVALYRAKAEGRGTYRFYTDSMDADVRARVALDNDLRDALALQQFFLVYQPQVDVDGHIIGVEALLRWQHPTRGVVEPAHFIPATERSGLINGLGAWVFGEACRQIRVWLDAGTAPPRVSVNLSALQFKSPLDLEKRVSANLAKHGVPPTMLELELTESTLMEASQQHNDVLLRLRQTGIRIAIDDFGNGYSSLDYLRRFPVDRIKIPQNFITDLGAVSATGVISEDAPIVRATIGLARELGIEAIAEGVETAMQFDLLKRWGCKEMQGFYFSKAVPAERIVELLRAGTIHPAGVEG